MATVPSTSTKAVGDKVSANWANTNVKSPLDFLLDPPRVQVYATAGQSIPNNTATALQFAGEIFDSDSMHDNVTNNTRITFNTEGLYELSVYIAAPTAAYTTFNVQILVNGATSARTLPFVNPPAGHVRFPFHRTFNAGDYIEVVLTQVSGAAQVLTGTGNNQTGVTAVRVGGL